MFIIVSGALYLGKYGQIWAAVGFGKYCEGGYSRIGVYMDKEHCALKQTYILLIYIGLLRIQSMHTDTAQRQA